MADEFPSPRNVEEHVKGLARYALQILALAASVLAALYLGSLLAEGVLGLLAANGGAVLGVAVLISVVREASKLLSSVLEYAAESSYEQMIASRAFSDREPDGSYSKEKAVLTRRAEVHVRNAPGCQLELPIRAGRAAAPGSIPRR